MMIGRAKTRVFPEPVNAMPIISRPFRLREGGERRREEGGRGREQGRREGEGGSKGGEGEWPRKSGGWGGAEKVSTHNLPR